MRNKLIALSLIISALIYSSCDKVDDILTFDVTDQSSFTIEAATGINLPFYVPTPDISTSSETEFANNDTKADLVKEILLKELRLSITSPAGEDFSFLNDIEVYISADGVNEILLASKKDIDENSSVIVLTTTTSKLDDYVKKDKYTLRTDVTTDEYLMHDIDVQVDMTYQVTADPL